MKGTKHLSMKRARPARNATANQRNMINFLYHQLKVFIDEMKRCYFRSCNILCYNKM